MKYDKWPSRCLLLAYVGLLNCAYADEKYNAIHRDGSFEFSYDTPDAFHVANGDRNNVVRGEFGGRDPKTGLIDKTTYTAGPRGYRPRGKNIARKYDLSQIGPRPIGSKDDPYFDPYEDPSYNFNFKTRTYSREENANRYGDVKGSYTYTDDVGERHNVEFIAGKRTGFHVKTPFPDSNPNAYGPLFYNGRGKPIPRGRTAIQRGLDGSYRFISAGPDQRRTETSDATGHVRGSYTYLDDKGVQHSVHYIAGPETGYRVLKNVKGPHLPTIYPFSRPDIIPPDYYDSFDKAEKELFDTAASGRPRPAGGGGAGASRPSSGVDFGGDIEEGGEEEKPQYGSGGRRPGGGAGGRPKPPKPPIDEYEDGGEDIDLFGGATGSTARPTGGGGGADGKYKPSGTGGGEQEQEEKEDGAFGATGSGGKPAKDKTTYDDGSYKPSENDGAYKPSEGEGSYRPSAEGRPSRPRPAGGPRPKPPGGSFETPRPTGEGFESPGSSSGGEYGRPSAEGRPSRPRPAGGTKPKPAGGTFEGPRPSGEGFESPAPSGGGGEYGRPTGEGAPAGGYEPSGGGGYSSTTTPGQYEPEEAGGVGESGSTPRPNYGFDGEGGSTVRPSGVGGGSTARPGGYGQADNFGNGGVSTYRPSKPIRPRPTRPPFGGRPSSGNRPSPKPETGFNPEEEAEDEDFNLFGSESSGPVGRPSSTTARPSQAGGFLDSDEGGGFDESGDRRRPSPKPSRPTRPGAVKPDFEASQADGEGVSGGGDKPAVIGVSAGGDSFFERGTIVTNLGDKVFSVPPGVSVRAHVQAIDLLPLGSRIPSPSEQYRAETTVQSDASERVSVTTHKTTRTYDDEEDIFK